MFASLDIIMVMWFQRVKTKNAFMWHPLEEAQDVDNKIKVNVSLSFGGKAICLSSSLCLCIAVGQVRGRCKRELGIQDMFIISQNHLINIYLCKRDRLPTKQKLSKKIIDNVLCNKSYTLPCCHKWLAVSHILQKEWWETPGWLMQCKFDHVISLLP